MTPLVAFILGLLVGWLVEWFIDWIYWRRRQAELQAQLEKARAAPASTALEGQLASLKGEHAALQQKSAGLEADKASLSQQLAALAEEKASLAARLEACQASLSAGKAQPVAEAPGVAGVAPTPSAAEAETMVGRMVEPAPVVPDDLIVIKGIGPVINRKLNEAGVFTFEQLGALTPTRLREIVGDVIQRLADEEAILSEARQLAARKAGKE